MGDNTSASENESPPQKKLRSTRNSKKNDIDDWQSNIVDLKERYKFMFNNELYTDVYFIVGEERQKISANKTVLSAASVVFHTMLSERWSSDNKEIEIPDIEPAAFKELLRFIYCTEARLTKNIVWCVLYAAKKYLINPLRSLCVEFIKMKMLSFYNACFFLMKARALNEDKLVELCLEVIEADTHHATYSNPVRDESMKKEYNKRENLNESFLNMDIGTLRFLLERDTLTVDEVDLFEAVHRWAQEGCKRQDLPVTAENKRSVLDGAISLIRFPLMSTKDFANVVPDTGLLSTEEQMSVLLYLTKKPRSPTNFNDEPRGCGRFAKKTIKIFVKYSKDTIVAFRVEPFDTVEHLLSLVKEEWDVSCVDAIRLIFDGKQLRHNRCLCDYKIKEKSVIHVWFRQMFRIGRTKGCHACSISGICLPYFKKRG